MIDRMEVWRDTQEIAKSQYSQVPLSIKYAEIDISNTIKKYSKTVIKVVNQDTIDTTLILKKHGLNPLLLNMATDKLPGGGVDHGAGAQEENIFRRSNYFLTLTQDFYPIKNTEVIYSPDITIFKSNEYTAYELMSEPKKLAMIACPAIRHPNITRDCLYFVEESDKILMKKKIEMILKTAIKHGHDSLVLSAHGCGAWCCPPLQISELYREVINKYQRYFQIIIFAILRNPLLQIGTQNNFDIFKKILEN